MLTITVGSPAMRDVSRGGSTPPPVQREDRSPGGVPATAARGRRPFSPSESAAKCFSLVSVRLLGVLEITRTRER